MKAAFRGRPLLNNRTERRQPEYMDCELRPQQMGRSKLILQAGVDSTHGVRRAHP